MPRSFLLTNRRYGATSQEQTGRNEAENENKPADSNGSAGRRIEACNKLLTLSGSYFSEVTATMYSKTDNAMWQLSSNESTGNPTREKFPVIQSYNKQQKQADLEEVSNDHLFRNDLDISPAPDGNHIHEDSDRSIYTHACSICPKVYTTSSNLARHIQTHRSATHTKAKTCPQCGKMYVSIPAYNMHLHTHIQCCVCQHCGKSFSRPWLLHGHIRTHTGEKPYKCAHCSKSFADKSNLRAHEQTHSPEKPFLCRQCGKTFALKSYLHKHKEIACLKARKHGINS